jgi:hypothetical protein
MKARTIKAAPVEKQPEPLPVIATERLHIPSAIREKYEPAKERSYFRNDGHKHLTSRGFRC